jgi:hypothetical protein
LKGFRFSIDYTQIRKSGEIRAPAIAEIINNEAAYPGRVIRGPNLPTDQPGWAGPVTSIDVSLVNVAATTMRAVDFQADYEWKIARLGSFHIDAVATRMERLRRQLLPGAAPYDLVGFFDGPLKWRGQGSLTWERGRWTAIWSTQYYSPYSVIFGTPSASFTNPTRLLNQGTSRIPSQIYHDFFVRYRIPPASSVLSNTEISVGIQDVFDSEPPAIADLNVFYSNYGDPRLRRFTVAVRKSF